MNKNKNKKISPVTRMIERGKYLQFLTGFLHGWWASIRRVDRFTGEQRKRHRFEFREQG